ncbi:DNA mismatch repair protein MutT [Solibacillus sp. R5-41]|uniref:NUDIX domain-containing protein n=1 Tax=Solibacillus sp. R5-41 TaxID=2048654 RepID=UPI000C1252F6|nr:NUDIX domain-containing protein [Solibacillus sp. R5-41]ATP40104.1 DNA mismatch repair protein MutT [Solibacillus sp. R5-41]
MLNKIRVNWGGHKVKLTWLSKKVVDLQKVTSVHGYCFYQGKILLVHVEGRGFNIPGGHVEKGESPEETFNREVYEEAYVEGDIQYLGAIEVSHEDNPLFVEGGKYPLIGYQLFYKMDIQKCHPFLRENETTCRIWVEPEEVQHVLNDHELSLLVLKDAINLNTLHMEHKQT